MLVTVGFLIGWVSPTKKILMSDASPTGSPLTDTEMSAIASTMTLAAIAGVPACSYVGEAYGRKAAILVIIALQMVSCRLDVIQLTNKLEDVKRL